jgi:hypothetical protein
MQFMSAHANDKHNCLHVQYRWGFRADLTNRKRYVSNTFQRTLRKLLKLINAFFKFKILNTNFRYQSFTDTWCASFQAIELLSAIAPIYYHVIRTFCIYWLTVNVELYSYDKVKEPSTNPYSYCDDGDLKFSRIHENLLNRWMVHHCFIIDSHDKILFLKQCTSWQKHLACKRASSTRVHACDGLRDCAWHVAS